MTEARFVHTATLLNNGKVLIAGGYNKTGFLSTAELYDPAKMKFTIINSMNVPRDNQTATLLGDGKVLIAGGDNLDDGYLSSAEIYDPLTNTFKLWLNHQGVKDPKAGFGNIPFVPPYIVRPIGAGVMGLTSSVVLVL
jgi:hypothetical protein